MTILNFFNVGNPVFLVSRRQVRPPARSKLVLVQDERFDSDWDRLVDWTGAPDSPLAIMNAYDLQGFWTGTFTWADQPQPEFNSSSAFFEHFNTGWIGTNVAPVNALVVAGTAALDQILSADVSGLQDEDGLPAANTYLYQWQWETSPDVFEDISGETASTYTVTRYTMGKRVRFRLQYQDLLLNDETIYSVATPVVPVVDIPVEGAPTIQNLTSAGQPAQQGHVLSAVTTAIFDFNTIASAFSYQWLRETAVDSDTYVEIDGATEQTYTVVAEDIDATQTKKVKVRVSYTDGLGKLESVDSVAGYATVDSPFSGTPSIDLDTAVFDVGSVLTANVSALQDANDPLTYEYQWYAEVFGSPGTFLAVEGATDAIFNVTADYQKRKLYLEVTTIDALGNRHVRQTAQTSRVNSLPEGAPYIVGTVQVGQTLSANTSLVSDYDTIGTKYYTWQSAEDLENPVWTTVQTISTGSTYVVKAADINKHVRVVLQYTDSLGKVEQVASSPVLIVNTAPTGVPTLSVSGGGNAEVGKVLVASVSGIADINTVPGGTAAYLYQWFIKDPFGANTYAPIAGATASQYTVQYEDVSQDIKVEVSFTDLGGTLETVVSSALRVQNSRPTGQLAVSVQEGGDPEVGKTLVADPSGIADVNGLGAFSYQWYKSDKYKGGSTETAISGATDSTYVIGADDLGYELYARATVTDLDPRDPKTHVFQSSATIPQDYVGSFALGSTVVFDGNDEYVISGLTPGAFPNGISISFSIYNQSGGNTYQGILNNGISGGDTSRVGSFDFRFSGATSAFVTINRWTSSEISVSFQIPENTWLDMTVVYDNRQIRVYSNGSLLASSSTRSTSAALALVPSQGIRIGRSAGTAEYLVGQLQDVRIYNRALTTGEVTALASADSASAAIGGTSVVRVKSEVSGQPVITGRQTVSAIVTADTSAISDLNGLGTFSYQWKSDGVNVGSNSSTYTIQNSDFGKNLTVTVSYTDKAGYAESITSEPFAVINYPPLGQLAISGTPQVSYTLTAGGITDANGITPANVTYQWLSGGVEVQNSDSPTYVVQATDYAKQMVVKATYTDDAGNVEAPDVYANLTSAAVTIVNSPATGEVFVVDQQGNQPAGVEEGVVLAADPSALRDINEYDDQTPDSFTYQWKRNGVNISGQTGQTYTAAFNEYGGAISVAVSFTDDEGNVETTLSSNSVNIVNSPPVGDVIITGEPRVGKTLTADTDGISDVNLIAEPSYILDYPDEYTFSGASTYIDTTVLSGRSVIRWYQYQSVGLMTVTFAQPQKFFGVQFYSSTGHLQYIEYQGLDDVWVRYQGYKGNNFSGWYPVNSSVLNSHVQAKAVRFSATEYQAYTVGYAWIKTEPRPDTHVFTYQWFRDDGTGPAAISGATSKNYVLTEADYGQNLTVRAAYNDLHGTAESVTSAPVLVDARGYPTIDGAVEVGQTVTANTSSMDDVEGVGTLHYAWEAQLPGATEFSAVGTDAATFVVPEGYEAATLRVTVSYDDLQGNPESAMSEIVYVRSDPTGAIALSGRDPAAYYVGDVVTADVSAIEDLNGFPAPSAITYQWRRNDVAITSRDSSAIYEQPIDIVNAGASSLSDYHVEVVLNTAALVSANKMLADSRVEFRDSLGNVIPYWFEGPENHQKSVYWLKMNLPVGTTTITARYSQDASFAACEGRAEDMGFLFFEDFDNGLDNWVKVGADGVLSTSSGNLVGTSTSAYLQSVAQFSDPVIARSVAIFPDSPTYGVTSIGFWNSTADQVSLLENNGASNYRNNANWTNVSFNGQGTGVIKDEITLTGTQAQVSRRSGSQAYSSGFFSHTQGTKPLFLGMRGDLDYTDRGYNGTWYYIHVRPYVAGANVSVALGTETLSYGSVYRLVADDSGQSINVVMSYTDLHGYAETVTSSAVAVSNSPATGSVSIDGSPYTGSTFTANTSGLADLDGIDSASYSYQWFVSGVEAAGETAVTYTVTAADVNQTITVRVDFADNTGATYSVTSAGRLILNTPATGEALITGTALVGETLTLDMSPVSDVDGSIQNISYQWYEAPARSLLASAETLIADATTDTFVIPAGAENKEYRAVVSYEDGNGGSYTQRVPKLASVPEQDLALLLDAAALSSYEYGTTSWNDLSGNGNNATVPSSAWSNIGQGRFVFRSNYASLDPTNLKNLGNNFSISGLITVSSTSGSNNIVFSSYGTNAGVVFYQSGAGLRLSMGVGSRENTYTSRRTPFVAGNTYFVSVTVANANTSRPDVHMYINGEELTFGWDSNYLEYVSWSISNTPAAVVWGEPSAAFVGRSDSTNYNSDIGFVSVHKRVLSDSEIASMYEALRDRLDAASPQRTIVQGAVVGLPVITGTPQAGSTLTANLSGMSDPNGRASAYTYQWKADGVNISGATSSTFALTANQFNKQVTVDVTFLDRLGASNTVTSAPVQIENTPATGTVTISGTPEVNQTLTAVTSGLQDANGKPVATAMSYQWYVDDVAVVDATASTYVIQPDDVFKDVHVSVSFTDSQGNAEGPFVSAPVTIVNSLPTGTFEIQGSFTQGGVVSVDVASIDDANGMGNDWSYQWKREGAPIPGATSSDYTLTAADMYQIQVEASYTDQKGTREYLTDEQLFNPGFQLLTSYYAASKAAGTTSYQNEPPYYWGPTRTPEAAEHILANAEIYSSPQEVTEGLVAKFVENQGYVGGRWYDSRGSGLYFQGYAASGTATSSSTYYANSSNSYRVTIDDLRFADYFYYTYNPFYAPTGLYNNKIPHPFLVTGTWQFSSSASFNFQWRAAQEASSITEANEFLLSSLVYNGTQGYTIEGLVDSFNTGSTDETFILGLSAGGFRTDKRTGYSTQYLEADFAVSRDDSTGGYSGYFSLSVKGSEVQLLVNGSPRTTTQAGILVDNLLRLRSPSNVGFLRIYNRVLTPVERAINYKTYYNNRRYTSSIVSSVSSIPAYSIVRGYVQGPLSISAYTGTYIKQGDSAPTAVANIPAGLTKVSLVHIDTTSRSLSPVLSGYGGSVADNWDTALSGTVTITGTPQQGQVLSVLKQGDWAGQSNFSYQWKRNGTNIFGATGATYTVQAADYGETIGVDVWFFSSAGVISSASATPVTIVNSPPVGTLTISGAVYSGQTITADPSFSDADTLGTLSYQWYADGVAIPDATASTYLVAEALGTAISVTASYVDGAGNAESVTSSPVLVGSAPPVGSVTIAGTYRVGEELTATVDVSDADGIQEGTTVYQWTRGGADIAGATALSYTLVDADIGQAVAMEVRYTDNLGDQESLLSAAAVVLGYPVVLANPLADQEVYAGLALSYTVPADAFNDPDGGVLTYAASGMPAWLAFDAASRTFSGTPSVDDVGTSTITVTATDSDADSASDTFVVAVLARVTESFEFDADDRWPGTLPEAAPNPAFNYSSASTSFDPASGWPAPPSITGSASVSVEENIDVATVVETYTANVSVTWSLAGTDAADFTIDNQGDLRFVQSPDFETKSSYSVTVVATDAAGSVSTEAVTVSVTNVFEGWAQTAVLTADDKEASDQFGYLVSVSSDGSTMVVGAPGEDSNGLIEAGAAYIFVKSGSSWAQVQKLTASDRQTNDKFGHSPAISDDGSTIVVGAYDESPDGVSYAGSAYIFVKTGSTWAQAQKITASDKEANDKFGYRRSIKISADGSTIVVGAYAEDPNGVKDAGAVYVFVKSGSTWTQVQKLTASDKATDDKFGDALSISADGSTIVVGAYAEAPDGVDRAGSAYIFVKSGSTWTQVQKLTSSDKAVADYFGGSISVSADGSIIGIGASSADPAGINSAGAAYIFVKSGSTWTQVQKLTSSDKAVVDHFGGSISVDETGTTIVIGAYYKSSGTNIGVGAVYVFSKSGLNWVQTRKIVASDQAAYDRFGIDVSVSGDGATLAVGASGKDPDGLAGAGAVYVFESF